ncbi:putative house-cleaning noncanonical NTP pyrophosphatase (MazG superfamily) [Evansella vedderi]|uniref:House-cleaning noncanonical NTP pyrophosphatase (MazG superfamily) n=2 Tax=Evansella vedderi TaxID=38282 RepID=A0ABU0A0U2_9BACI|nr:putative house-cleaning noncanonical NTP pyrophosphatase (MazG superfamily) [Evansella vedderi]
MEYHSRGEFPTAEIERRTAEGREEVKGEAALEEIEELIQQISLHSELLPEEVIDKILAYLNISKEEVKSLELEVDFKKGDKIKGDI